MGGFEENEVSKNANGGTELTKRLITANVPADLLEHFQLIASRVRELDESKIRVFWANDVAEDTENERFSDPNFLRKFHAIVFTSHWLQQRYMLVRGVPYEKKCQVIEAAVDPIEPDKDKWDKFRTVNLTYFSTPNRGLALLVPVFEKMQEKWGDQIHLDVFSSFKIYGWDDFDKQFEPLYEQCRKNPGISYHGFQPHDVLKDYLAKEGHILAYPCIWPETACRVVIEAMSAKLLCVHPNYAALPETTGSQNLMYCGDQDANIHANIFLNVMDQAVTLVKNRDPFLDGKLNFNKMFVDGRFGSQRIGFQWTNLLKALVDQYPTPESRKFVSDMFVYRG